VIQIFTIFYHKQKFHVLPCYGEHEIMILYDNNVSLTQRTIRNFGVELIVANFNENTQESLYIIAIYLPHT
jgi:hypothetical protein